MRQGYVKLWRKMLDSPVWGTSLLTFKLWTWILMSAAHKQQRLPGLTLEPGELLTTYAQIAEALTIPGHGFRKRQEPSIQNLRTSMQALCDLYVITKQQAPQQGGLHIKVLHWDRYQGTDEDEVTGHATGVSTDLQQTPNTIQECKEGREEDLKELTLLSEFAAEKVSKNGGNPSVRKQATSIWEHWLAVWPEHGRMTFTDDRRRRVEARIREGIPLSTIRSAIEHSRLDPWWSGARDGEWKADLRAICSQGSTIERLAFDARNQTATIEQQRVQNLREMRARLGDEAVRPLCETDELWREVCGA